MAFEIKFHNREAAYEDIDPFLDAYDTLIPETKYFLPVQNDNPPITIVAKSLLKARQVEPILEVFKKRMTEHKDTYKTVVEISTEDNCTVRFQVAL